MSGEDGEVVEIKSVAAPDRAWKSPGPNGHGGGVRILVDYRETALWSELSGRWADHKAHGGGGGPAVTLEQAPLLVGDVELTAAAGPLVRRWIWERKSLADLSASIVDGRWTEQRRRMCSAYPVGHVHYLIEGNPFDPEPELEPKFGVSDAAMRSALLRVQLDEGVHVHHYSTSPRPSSSGGAVTAAEYISRAVEGILRGVQEWARGGRAHGGTLGAAADVQQAYNDGAVRTAALDVKKGASVTPELCYTCSSWCRSRASPCGWRGRYRPGSRRSGPSWRPSPPRQTPRSAGCCFRRSTESGPKGPIPSCGTWGFLDFDR